MESLLYHIVIFAFINLSYISHQPKVCAYLDPGTGSFIIQLILGVLFGSLLAIKLFWISIKGFFKKLFSIKRNTRKDEG